MLSKKQCSQSGLSMHLMVYKHRASIGTKVQTSLALSAVIVFIAICRFNEQKNLCSLELISSNSTLSIPILLLILQLPLR